MKDYKSQYLDPRWQKKRLKIFERDNFTCQKCFETDITLHLHHRRYLRDADVWDCPDELLITLCAKCHLIETEFINVACFSLIDTLKEIFWAYDISNLNDGFKQLKNIDSITSSIIMHFLYEEKLQILARKNWDEWLDSTGGEDGKT